MRLTISKSNLPKNLIVFGIVISTFTHLRLSFLGLGEIIFIVFGLLALLSVNSKIRFNSLIFFKFWVFFLLLSVIGFGYNVFILNFATGSLIGVVFDGTAYFLLMISCLAVEKRFVVNEDSPDAYLSRIFFAFTLTMSFLFALSKITPTIAGLPLTYHHYFAPLVKNLHQAAMILAPMPFIGLAILPYQRSVFAKYLCIVLIALSVVMILATGSTKAKLGIALGTMAFGFITLLNRKSKVEIILAVTAGLVALLVAFSIDDPVTMARSLFDEADGHGSRAYLYTASLRLIEESWLFGRGTGGHILHQGIYNDAHQTFLTVFLQAGVFAFILCILLLAKVIITAAKANAAIFAAILCILIYALGGDILRRLPIWLLLIVMYHFTQKIITTKRLE